MNFGNVRRLKDWIYNLSKKNAIEANVVLQHYMMERFLERVALSPYRNNLILKGGFLIAAMIGIDRRSTMDIDTTIKHMSVNHDEIARILREIIAIDPGDNTSFEIQSIKNIHDVSKYDDFRAGLLAKFDTLRVNMKIDITTGDAIIPREIEYSYKLMFEERHIHVMAYNIYTILAEKIETVLSRNVANSRARDFYDIYALLSLNRDALSRDELLQTIRKKAEERGSAAAVENYEKHLTDIGESPDIANIWDSYAKKYPYANAIELRDILSLIRWTFDADKT
jgi:predicted nucleotidyltransferase component of viral defense system